MKLKRLLILSLLMLSSSIMIFAQTKLSGLKIVKTSTTNVNISTTNEISQYNITWTFSEPVEYGTFVNGDYWVIGPVTVESVSPEPTQVNGNYLNGSMINPELGSQGYDSRTTAYGEPYDHSARIDFPITIEPNSSLISSVSREPSVDAIRPALQTAAVLTVLSEQPPGNSFRPGLIGSNKTLYSADDINWANLPSLAPTSSAPSSIDSWEEIFQKPWLLHNGSWTSRSISPVDNMPSYHQWIAQTLSYGAVIALTDLGFDRTKLVTNYIQVAIDYYTMQQAGTNGRYNYRWPTIFAGIMLEDSTMRDMWLNGDYGTPAYQDGKLYRWGDHTRTVMSSIIPDGYTWTGATIFWRSNNDQNVNADEHEHLDPSEWGWIESAGYPGGGSKQETYRRMHSVSTVGFSLAAKIMDAQISFDFPEYFTYAERWMSETPDLMSSLGVPVADHPVQTSKNSFVDEMWFKYYY